MSILRNATLLLLSVLAGCGGRAFVVEPFDDAPFRGRAVEQQRGTLSVRAAVAGAAEAELIFGVSLYRQGVQPVWLEVENRGDTLVRYAPASTDLEYFAPLEVSYKNRRGYSDQGRQAMDLRFHRLAMPRLVEPGATVSGFVFTHLDSGTKAFNVDIFGAGPNRRFTFFINVPGFVPDHSQVDFRSIYPDSEVRHLDDAGVYSYLRELACCASDQAGERDGGPLNLVLIGQGMDILYSLLRAGWDESAAGERPDVVGGADYYWRGRRQDAIFRHHGKSRNDGYYEMRVWLAPVTYEGLPIWLTKLRHYVNHPWTRPRPDPDIDGASWFAGQNFWYAEALKKNGWVNYCEPTSLDDRRTDFQGATWFSQGFRLVLWLAGDSVSMAEVETAGWDNPVTDD